MRSITCGTSLSSLGQVEVFNFGRIRLSDIKRMENFARCYHRIHLQDEVFQGGTLRQTDFHERQRASCGLINRFLGPCSHERNDTMRTGASRS